MAEKTANSCILSAVSPIPLYLKSAIEKIAKRRRSEEGLRSRPVGNVERGRRMRACGGAPGRVLRAQGMLDHAAVHAMAGLHAVFGVDEKTLTADGTTNVRGQFRWLA
ncbi:MAG: hypothetical protein ACRD3K_06585 [Edaphobacter sp.]